jgi:hypothetical protein
MMHEFVQSHAYNWKLISKQPLLPIEVMRQYADRLDWESVCEFRPLPESAVEEFEAYIDWKSYCRYQPLTEGLLQKYYSRLPWPIVVVRQNLSMNIIKEFWYYIEPYVDLAVRYQVFDPLWMESKRLRYPATRMDPWSSGQKWERCLQFSYEGDIDRQVVYAYKSTQKDGYSILNQKIRYDVGFWSKDWHCDGNFDIPYSFGLSAGQKQSALHHYPKGSLFMVEIPLDDLYCVTGEGVIRTLSMLPVVQIK